MSTNPEPQANPQPNAPANEPTPQPNPSDPAPAPAPNADPANPAPADPPKPDSNSELHGFSADWRQKLAGDDDKALKQLERFSSPKAMHEALNSSRQKITELSAGKAPGADAKPEEIAAYREANGIPKESAGYWDGIKLPEGMELSEEGKGVWKPLLENLHSKNVSPELFNEMVEAKIQVEQAEAAAQIENDGLDKQETEDELRTEWGSDYRANVNTYENLINKFVPQDARAEFDGARMADGSLMTNNPAMMRAFAEMGRLIAPAGTVVATDGASIQSTIEDQLKGYEKQMGTKEWHGDEKAQGHYRELVSAYERTTGKQWAGSA